LRCGAGYDVVGDRFLHVHRNTRREVVARWPRDGFSDELQAIMRAEADRNPHTRIGFLCHRLSFLALIRDTERRFRADAKLQARTQQ